RQRRAWPSLLSVCRVFLTSRDEASRLRDALLSESLASHTPRGESFPDHLGGRGDAIPRELACRGSRVHYGGTRIGLPGRGRRHANRSIAAEAFSGWSSRWIRGWSR